MTATLRVLLLVLLPAGLMAAGAKRPNIILILTDDLGYGDVGVFHQNQRLARHDRGVPFLQTPWIDTLARDGLMLRQHYCGAPVCAPSRASLLTGRTQGHASVRDNQFDRALAEKITLGSVLQQAGYATAAIGKWGLQGGGEAEKNPRRDRPAAERQAEWATWTTYPTRRGFDFFYGYVRHRDGHFHYPKEDGREIWENDREVSAGLDLCYTTDLFTARAKKWIVEQRAARPDQPFFLYLAYDTPHAVLANPPSAYPAGGGLRGGVQWTGRPGAMINTATGRMDGWMHPDYVGATWDHDGDAATAEQAWPEVQKRYANDVRRIDDGVGDLLQLLTDLQLAEDTLVVFTSDNGPSQESYLRENFTPDFFHGFGPFDGIKRDTLEGGIREPTLVRWPAAVPAGRVSDQPTGQWDWLATFAEAAGVAIPAASDGVSLLPTLTGRGAQRPSTLYVEYFNPQRTPGYPAFIPVHRNRPRGQMQVVLVDGLKGLRYGIQSAGDPFEIYNVTKDPQESVNLAADPALAGLQARMQARVLQVRRPDPAAPRPYDQAPVPPGATAPTMTGSLSWARYEGEWPWLPDLRRLRPAATGTAASLEPVMLPAGKPGALGFFGHILVPADGTYTFSFAGRGETMLFLHDIRVLDTSAESQGLVRLAAGWHPLRLYYRTDGRDPALDLVMRDEQGNTVPLPPASFAPLTPP